MMDKFFVRCNCKNRSFTGGKSRFLQAADGGKDIRQMRRRINQKFLRKSNG